ncbi:hypothetical protein Enr13x_69830 [Stieleria neptunia]|uniref:Uncharacterized protein n=1 Tax=Stieleria neptunia TaxID=2527979 RepID=A0A518I207_9BACT|nr:hypothetical protein Enr13x_69830 [Stieleria neptunia]
MLLTNAAVWYALQGFAPLAVLIASLFASFVAREIVGTFFQLHQIYHETYSDEYARLLAQIDDLNDDSLDGDSNPS